MNKQSNAQGADAPARLSPRPKLPILIPLAVLLGTVGLILWSAWPILRPARSIAVTQVIFDRSAQETEQPNDQSAAESIDPTPPRSTQTVQAAGWLEAEPFITACTALADGVLAEMLVLEGDRVSEGQIVAKMVDADARLSVRRARADLSAAQAELSVSRAELAAARSAWNEPVELDRAVESGRAALAESEAELAQLPSLITGARAVLVQYEEEHRRVEDARAGNAATELEVIIARQRVLAQQAEIEALLARGPILESRTDRLRSELRAATRDMELRIDDRARLDTAAADVERAKARVEQLGAALEVAELELDRMTIRAPISGYVQRRLKAPGDKVVRMMDDPYSAHLLHLYDPDRLQVRVDVPLADASHIFVGQQCEVVVEVLPDRVFRGEVLRITHEADLQKNTLQIKVRVIDPSPILRPEMLTRVKFLPDTPSDQARDRQVSADPVVRVPADAISSHLGSAHVWLITDRANGRGVLRAVPVESLNESDGWATVRGALHPGDLIAEAPSGLNAGELVRIVAADGENR